MSRKNDQQQAEQVKRPSKLTTCMITQSVLPKYWRWTAAELAALDRGESIASLILRRFRVAGLTVIEMHSVNHDKDKRTMIDDYGCDYQYILTGEHVHIVVKFAGGATLETIAEIAGLEPKYVGKSPAGGRAYTGLLGYMCHAKYPRKYRYDPQAVVTLVGKSYMDYYAANIERWLRTRYQRIINDAKTILNEIRVRIIEDGLDLKGIVSNDQYMEAYYFHRAKIDGWLQNKRDIDLMVRSFRQSDG